MEKMEIQKNEQKKIFTTKRLNKPIYVVDIEADGLLDEVTKIHCLSYGQMVDDQFWVKTLTDYEDIKKFVSRTDITIVGHNFVSYDNLVLEKILGISIHNENLIDSLYLSWALYPKRLKHGLEDWGKENGQYKKEIKDWKNLSQKKYIERCEGDVKNNLLIWKQQFEYMSEIYEGDFEHFIDFIMFISSVMVYQELNPCKYDVKSANELLEKLEAEKEIKTNALEAIMPNVQKKTTKTIKNVVKISNEEYYQKGDLMYEHYLRLNYPIVDHKIVKITGEAKPNANSPKQLKDWLYDLGWTPQTFRTEKKDGNIRKIEQIMSEEGDGTLCPSIKELFSVEPGLEHLEGIGILKHRIGLVKGMNRDQRNGYIQGSLSGLTQTYRIKHKFLVNLPKPSKAYGKEIRGLIIAENKGLLIGSDLVNIESRTKNHWIYPYDPEYVKEMSGPIFDSHLDTAIQGGLITPEESHFYKWYDSKDKENFPVDEVDISNYLNLSKDLQSQLFKKIKVQRNIGKNTNFSAQYGAGAASIADKNKIPLKVAKIFHKAYNDRNWAVKKFADSITIKKVQGQDWMLNPISNIWYFLKAKKDVFSGQNQGFATYCFFAWLKYCRELGVYCRLNIHDEILVYVTEDKLEETKLKLKQAMTKLNEILQLNVTIDCSMDVGTDYSSVH